MSSMKLRFLVDEGADELKIYIQPMNDDEDDDDEKFHFLNGFIGK
jgi:hypothetical protein